MQQISPSCVGRSAHHVLLVLVSLFGRRGWLAGNLALPLICCMKQTIARSAALLPEA
jgi:hypothetical protein